MTRIGIEMCVMLVESKNERMRVTVAVGLIPESFQVMGDWVKLPVPSWDSVWAGVRNGN